MDIEILSKTFFNDLGLNSKDGEFIPWRDGTSVGFSILKRYPLEGSFIPVKNRDGTTDDSVVLIKIWYLLRDDVGDLVNLGVSVNKVSKYLFNHFVYNFEDKNSPDKESVRISESSIQPHDLEELYRFKYKKDTHKIIDLKEDKEVTGKELVDYVYNLHLKTMTHIPFRAKIALKWFGYHLFDYVAPVLKKIMSILHRDVLEDKEDVFVGIFKPYNYKKHVRQEEIDKIEILGVPVPKVATIITSVFFTIIATADFIGFCTLGVSNFIKIQLNASEVFLVAFVIIVVYGVDFLLPRSILGLINLCVFFRNKLMSPSKIE